MIHHFEEMKYSGLSFSAQPLCAHPYADRTDKAESIWMALHTPELDGPQNCHDQKTPGNQNQQSQ